MKSLINMKHYLIKELRIIGDETEVRQFKKIAMTVDELLYDLQGSISKDKSKNTEEIRITIKEVKQICGCGTPLQFIMDEPYCSKPDCFEH